MTALLAVLIAFAQVAGAVPCGCCGPVARAPSAADSVPEPTCCRAGAENAPQSKSPRQNDRQPRECCKSHCVVAEAVTPKLIGGDGPVDFGGPTPFGLSLRSTVAPVADFSSWRQRASDYPFLTTSTRLYAHHALLC